ncbi:MAG: helix-turn-helix domain-containing protein [Parvibaculum sp.]|uniref:helix-turn-helix domain-containing protein n=1 Tax=Parvibaculum sp. TaxID=2024848 RepID=UPI0027225A20|nr:helix-turn-helix domain-containing protein [Parvibaculum sp.]MDO8837996.1 helix-turn-helix domain-containing protein [Parvibaculum sp.]
MTDVEEFATTALRGARRTLLRQGLRGLDQIFRPQQAPTFKPPTPRNRAVLLEIDHAIERDCGLSFAMLLPQCRARRFSRPRMLAMWLARQHTDLSLPQIGRRWERDHTTVIHACQSVGAWRHEEAHWRDRLCREVAGRIELFRGAA